jgi:transposase
MVQAEGTVGDRRVRRWRSIAERRRIVERKLAPGASVALVSRAHGVNANQVFKWRRAFERGELSEHATGSAGLLPVMLSAACETGDRAPGAARRQTTSACIHIEFPGRAMICVESGADPVLLRWILESLRK